MVYTKQQTPNTLEQDTTTTAVIIYAKRQTTEHEKRDTKRRKSDRINGSHRHNKTGRHHANNSHCLYKIVKHQTQKVRHSLEASHLPKTRKPTPTVKADTTPSISHRHQQNAQTPHKTPCTHNAKIGITPRAQIQHTQQSLYTTRKHRYNTP